MNDEEFFLFMKFWLVLNYIIWHKKRERMKTLIRNENEQITSNQLNYGDGTLVQ